MKPAAVTNHILTICWLLTLLLVVACLLVFNANIRLTISKTWRQHGTKFSLRFPRQNTTGFARLPLPAAVSHLLNTKASKRVETLWNSVGCLSEHPILLCRNTVNLKRDLLQAVATEKDFRQNIYLKKKHSSCALVGSSGNLKNHKLGREIDRHQTVIRINNPPLVGYEQYVGKRKADILVVNNRLRRCVTPTKHRQLYIRPTAALLSGDSIFVQSCHQEKKLMIYSISKYVEHLSRTALLKYTERYKMKHRSLYLPTSGFRVLFFCLLICKQVHVYGFGVEGARTFHYYSNDTHYKPPWYHNIPLEMTMMQMIENGTFDHSVVDLTWKGFGRLYLH